MKDNNTLSSFAAFSNLFLAFMGLGTMVIPSVFRYGIFLTPITLFLVSLLLCFCYFFMLEAAEVCYRKYPNILITYPDVGREALGEFGHKIALISLTGGQIGACICYCSFMGNILHDLYPVTYYESISIIYIPLIILTQVRNVKGISYAAYIGIFVMIIAIFECLYDGAVNYCCASYHDMVKADWKELPDIIGTSALALQGIGMVLPVRQKTPISNKSFLILSMSVILTVFTTYCTFGVLCYVFWGNNIETIILLNLGDFLLAKITKIAISIVIMLSFVLQNFIVIDLVDSYLINTYVGVVQNEAYQPLIEVTNQNNNNKETPNLIFGCSITVLQTLIRIVVTSIIVLISIAAKDLDLIVSLVGGVASSMISFTLPPIFYLYLKHRDKERFSMIDIFAKVSIMVGLFSIVSSIYHYFYTVL